MSNALRVYETLRRDHPRALELLSQQWPRDGATVEFEPFHGPLLRGRFPVFSRCERTGGPWFRYPRCSIEVGQEGSGQPLDATERHAFDLLDTLLERPDNVARLRLEVGDILLLNNRALAHDRAAGPGAPGAARDLRRIWLTAGR